MHRFYLLIFIASHGRLFKNLNPFVRYNTNKNKKRRDQRIERTSDFAQLLNQAEEWILNKWNHMNMNNCEFVSIEIETDVNWIFEYTVKIVARCHFTFHARLQKVCRVCSTTMRRTGDNCHFIHSHAHSFISTF